MKNKFAYSFKGKVWKYKGPAGWYFVTLPKKLAKEIRAVHRVSEEGWGRLKTAATVGDTKWETAIWYDTKAGSYVLPIKAVIRKKESIDEGSSIKVDLNFNLEKWLADI